MSAKECVGGARHCGTQGTVGRGGELVHAGNTFELLAFPSRIEDGRGRGVEGAGRWRDISTVCCRGGGGGYVWRLSGEVTAWRRERWWWWGGGWQEGEDEGEEGYSFQGLSVVASLSFTTEAATFSRCQWCI